MRLALGVRIILGVLAQSLEDDEFFDLDLVGSDGGRERGEIFVDILDDDFGGFAGEDLIKHISAAHITIRMISRL